MRMLRSMKAIYENLCLLPPSVSKSPIGVSSSYEHLRLDDTAHAVVVFN